MAITLNDIIAMSGINTEDEENDAIVKLLKPTTREETGKAFTSTLGYNPITVFDEQEMLKVIEDYGSPAIENNKQEIISNAIEYMHGNGRIGYQITALTKAVSDVIGKETADEFDKWATSHYKPVIAYDDDYDEDDCCDDEDDDEFDNSSEFEADEDEENIFADDDEDDD